MHAEKFSIPLEFGGFWSAFSQEWCRGGSLGTSPADVARALTTLVRLWPEEIARLVSEPARGLGVVAPVVELGLLLHTCEPSCPTGYSTAPSQAGRDSARLASGVSRYDSNLPKPLARGGC